MIAKIWVGASVRTIELAKIVQHVDWVTVHGD